MIPVYQTKFGGSDDPEEDQGNCMQACIASILEIPLGEAPDFTGKIVNGEWYTYLISWLAERNLGLMFTKIKEGAPPGIHMVGAESTNLPDPDDGHMMVVQDGKVIHNPHPDNKGEGKFLEFWTFVPLDASKVVG